MRYVTTPVASQLAGLSTEKLREWTIRRALISADVCSKRKGSPAKFSWQTILLLRIAVLLREQFNMELQAQKQLFAQLQQDLHNRSFISMWGHRLILGPGTWSFIGESDSPPPCDVLMIHLDPHLRVLRDGFFPPNVAIPSQPDLFSLPSVYRKISADDASEVSQRKFA